MGFAGRLLKQRSLRSIPVRLLLLEDAEEELVVVEAAEEELEDKNFMLDQRKSVNGKMCLLNFKSLVQGIVMKSKYSSEKGDLNMLKSGGGLCI